MVAKYHNKWGKSQEAKWRSAEERRPVHELERVMDVDLFLEAQSKWAEDSPHCLVILHEMFLHAASEGWKEVEWVICRGHWQHMPQLNPEAGIPAFQLVGPETSLEELLKIYLEVYKQHRLPGSPPGELAILQEVLVTVPDHPQEKEETSKVQTQPRPKSSHPSKGGKPHWGREGLVDRSLARMCKAHQKVVSAAMDLEEEIERLCQIRAHSQSTVRSKSQDCQMLGEQGHKKRCCHVGFEDEPTPG